MNKSLLQPSAWFSPESSPVQSSAFKATCWKGDEINCVCTLLRPGLASGLEYRGVLVATPGVLIMQVELTYTLWAQLNGVDT